MSKFLTPLGSLLCLLIPLSTLLAQPVVELELMTDGLVRPVCITHAGDERLFVLEQAGKVRILDSLGTLLPTPFLNIESSVRDAGGEEGLLGLAFHPNYANNGLFYLNYTTGNETNRRTRVSRFERDSLNPDRANPASEFVLLEVAQPFGNHNGGDLHFGPDDYLYISIGDGGSGGDPYNNGQDSLSLLGKILRINVNGGTFYAIPPDNPFIQEPNAQNEIWSLGWRNPWRFSFDRLTGDMWVGDVGQGAFEEISFEPAGQAGLNYGWRCKEGNAEYNGTNCLDSSAFVGPVFDYGRDASDGGRSVTGGYVYRGERFGALYGQYVFADYQSGNFWTIAADSNQIWQSTLQGRIENGISAFGEDKEGELYAAKLLPGRIYRVIETAVGPTSLDSELTAASLMVFPNPLRQGMNVSFENPAQEFVSLRLFDLQGRIVRELAPTQTGQFWVSRGNLSTGMYVLEVLVGEKQSLRKKIMVAD